MQGWCKQNIFHMLRDAVSFLSYAFRLLNFSSPFFVCLCHSPTVGARVGVFKRSDIVVVSVKCVQNVYVFARTHTLSPHQESGNDSKSKGSNRSQYHRWKSSSEHIFHISFVITYSLCTERTKWNDNAL